MWFAVTLLATQVCLPESLEKKPIKVSANLEGQSYCPGDNETFAVHLKLRLHFTNYSNERLIVFKKTGDDWYDIRVAKSPSDISDKRYEYNPNTDWFSDVQHSPDDTDLKKKFVVLAPGESFENKTTISVVASFNPSHPVGGTVKPGQHVLELQLSTWTYLDSPEATRARWERYGNLFSQSVTTEPVEFEFPSSRLLNNCH
jgi:hypothetical protein